MSDLPTSLSEAKRLGARYYWTGKPCVRGHLGKRITHRGECYRCHLNNARAWQMRVKSWRLAFKNRPKLFRIRAEDGLI